MRSGRAMEGRIPKNVQENKKMLK